MTCFPDMSNKIYRCRFEETNPKVNLLSSIHANLQIINLWKVSLSYLKITKIRSVVDLNATNSTFSDSETVLNIVYGCSSVFERSLHKMTVLSA